MPEFQKLFSPGRIGNLDVKNRIVMPPMATHFATDQGDVTDRLIDMAGLVGCEVATFLAENGNKITLIFPESEAAPDGVYPDVKKHLLKKLEENKITIETEVRQFKEITSDGLAFVDKDGREASIQADKIILATGARPRSTLAQSLRGKVPELYEAGDCAEVRRLLEAIHEGAVAALKT
jgi:pyruvate/2-oxoglutarate dehydrogenase complex dihydrolipoamide dehydrogenase (E3) component